MPESPVPSFAPAEDLLLAVLNTSFAAVLLLRPVPAPGGAADFAFEQLNPAAQRLLGLPERPIQSLLTHFSDAGQAGLLAFFEDVFRSEQPVRRTFVFRSEVPEAHYEVAAQRSGERLVVSFTPAPPEHGALEEARHGNEAREQPARDDAARHERNLLQLVLTQAPVAIGLFQGPELVVAAANEQLCAMWGYPRAQVLGRPLLLAVPELQNQVFAKLIKEVARTGVPYVGTEQPATLRQNDQLVTRYYNFVYQPLYDPAGKLLGVLAIAIDVTDQVTTRQEVQNLNEELATANEELQASNEEFLLGNAELLRAQTQLRQLTQQLEARVTERTAQLQLALREAEQQRERLREQQSLLRLILGEVPAAIATLTGPEHRYSYFNTSYHALSEGRAQLDLRVADVFPEVVEQGFIELLDEVYRSGQPFVGQEMPARLYNAQTGQPEQRYVDFIYQPLADAQGRTTGILAFIIDATEKVRARQTEEASARQLRLITDALPVLISYVDRHEHYQFANRAYEAWFNQRPEELLSRSARDVLGEQAYRGVKPYIDRVLSGERIEFEARMPYREDFVRHIHVDYVPDQREGQVHGFYALVSDVTEQVLAREQVAAANEQLRARNADLDALNQQLRRTNQDLDNFVYTASHDLKAPITNIEGLLLALTEQLPPEALQQDLVEPILERMHGAVDRFKRTIDYLTDVSKLQQEHAQPPEPVPLAPMIEDVRQDLLPLLRATGAELEIDVAQCGTISFSPKNLRSVLYNLISNAVKYHHPGRPPRVRISCEAEPGRQRLRVQDNGLGLDEGQRGKVFGMFQRLHTHVEGSGIGLYMVKRILENAGGTISVDSQPGEGSTFIVDIPT